MSQHPTPDNRSAIAHHALDLFAAHGYDAVGVQDICAAAGVTKPTLYHYFGSKRGLLEAVVRERGMPFMAELESAAAYNRNLPNRLLAVVRAYLGFATREPALYRVLLAVWFTVPENEAFAPAAEFNAGGQAIIEDLFTRATADHGNMRGRARVYALTLTGTINAYIAAMLRGDLSLDDATARQLVRQFSHGIYS